MYACLDCGAQFKDSSNLRRHRRVVHSAAKPFNCSKCGKGFSRSDHLKRHAEAHERVRQVYGCEIEGCGRVFTNKEHHEIHVALHRKKIEDSKILVKGHVVEKCHKEDKLHFKCPFTDCNNLYASYSGIIKHINRHETNTLPEQIAKQKNKQPHCSICQLVFKNKSAVRRHKHKVHWNTSNTQRDEEGKCLGFQCTYAGCSRIFSNRKNVMAHMKNVHESGA
ncbi:hypothetical protein BgAZ_101390 [Babesia gibsoni]|uniref:C2H2-type domain-containing protein n=1 Tax=Babesia gibsoni TaxID=33632 RepID=A0AAD8PF32_BABGI|nr:hypothetical protein BgAZ_101390 [Babesia gibsoni]